MITKQFEEKYAVIWGSKTRRPHIITIAVPAFEPGAYKVAPTAAVYDNRCIRVRCLTKNHGLHSHWASPVILPCLAVCDNKESAVLYAVQIIKKAHHYTSLLVSLRNPAHDAQTLTRKMFRKLYKGLSLVDLSFDRWLDEPEDNYKTIQFEINMSLSQAITTLNKIITPRASYGESLLYKVNQELVGLSAA